MRYRKFGQSELVVSEVGFGAWTIATDWWGKVGDKAGLVHAALDAGVTFFDTAPVYGDDGFGETILAEILGRRDDVIVTTKVGYDIDAPRIAPGHSERPQDWRPESVRSQVEASLRRLGRDHIDLLQLHNVRIEPVQDDALWDELARLQAEGKVRELGIALGPAIGWVDEGLDALRNRPIATLQTVFNLLEQEPGRATAYNVCSGRPISIRDVAAAVAPAGLEPTVTGEYRLGDVRHIVASPERARAQLGFTAEVGPDEGLARFATDPLRA